jgi:hypothetical protein
MGLLKTLVNPYCGDIVLPLNEFVKVGEFVPR